MLTNRREVIFFCFLGLILIILLAFISIFGSRQIDSSENQNIAGIPQMITDISIDAKSAYVYDVYTGKVLYAKNENIRLPLASLTKLMSALVAIEIVPEYGVVQITNEALITRGESGLVSGEHWILKDLLDFSLMTSANDGIRAIALALGSISSSTPDTELVIADFVEMMNAKAESLGMTGTYYLNDTGLDESESRGGAYGSAFDQAKLVEYIIKNHPTLLSATKEISLNIASLDGILHVAHNTNTIAVLIPGLMVSKTGSTSLAGGNLIIVFDPEIGRPIIVSILGSTEEGRFNDALKLVGASIKSVENSVRLE
ncbi:MAG: hypothetical protein AAB660_00430 [Patescibacteria group bacterium]